MESIFFRESLTLRRFKDGYIQYDRAGDQFFEGAVSGIITFKGVKCLPKLISYW